MRHRDLVAFSRNTEDVSHQSPHRRSVAGDSRRDSDAAAIPDNEKKVAHAFDAEQQAANVVLKSNVLELEDLIETTGEVQVEGIRSSESLLALRVANSRTALAEFDADFRCPTASRFARDKYIDLLALRTSTTMLARTMRILQRVERLDVAADAPGEATPPPHQTPDVRSAAGSVAEIQLPDHEFGPQTEAAAQRAEQLLARLSGPLDGEGERTAVASDLGAIFAAFFPPHGGDMSRNLASIHEISTTDVLRHVKAALARGAEELDKAVADAAAADDALATATASLDDDARVEQAGAALRAAVAAHEHVLRLAKARLGQVMMERGDESNLRSTYERARDSTQLWVDEQREDRSKLASDAAEDLAAIRAEQQKREEEHQQAQQAFERGKEGTYAAMDALGEQQAGLWREVEERVAQISTISAERFKLVQKQLAASEEEWRRRRFHDEFVAVHTAHEGHLQTHEALNKLSVSLLDQIGDQLEKLSAAVDTKDMNEGMDDMRSSELQRFAEAYPTYAVTANRLLARLETRSRMAGRAARLARANMDLTAKALDPQRRKYQSQAAAEQEHAEELEAEARGLATSVELWDEYAEGIEEACRGAGVAIDVSHEADVKEWQDIVAAARADEAKVQREEAEEVEREERARDDRARAAEEGSVARKNRIAAKRSVVAAQDQPAATTESTSSGAGDGHTADEGGASHENSN